MLSNLSSEQEQIIRAVKTFVDREVVPVATEMEHRDEYPHALVERMKELGLFGANIPEAYGGQGATLSTMSRCAGSSTMSVMRRAASSDSKSCASPARSTVG